MGRESSLVSSYQSDDEDGGLCSFKGGGFEGRMEEGVSLRELTSRDDVVDELLRLSVSYLHPCEVHSPPPLKEFCC